MFKIFNQSEKQCHHHFKIINFNKGEEDTCINKITIETIEKNSKYKIINFDNSYYIINLNRNKIFYIFPLLNYITRQPLIEVNKMS